MGDTDLQGFPRWSRGGAARRATVAAAVSATMFGLACTPAFAVLSPYWQRVTEMKAIMADEGVAAALQASGPIISVTAGAGDGYEVATATCRLRVTVVDAPKPVGAPAVGPRTFALKLGEPVCR
ncbi:hypothetical protein SAMN02745172_04285 [Pseudoxanthobacter soli DSM 19599]|uniref:Uncharacterized protein n=1 Tax=Pseudoxanthobacter soli DSM 19599 TaxID=1123029 RepID=A0A1M7ZRS2_9HYPH|nr:hypothetical protein [Pseudoxanthobacter soli]SHO67604.1 hypothetical protein SAMN02745172_04285 [Pseudoxanthobacter soli DSM 19599]